MDLQKYKLNTGINLDKYKIKPEQEPGLIQGLVQGATKSFLKPAVTGGKAIQGLFGIATRDLETVKKAASQEAVDLGYFGKVKPIQGFLEAAGTGIEIGATLASGGVGKAALGVGTKGLIKEGVKRGAIEGAKVGGLIGFGDSLQQEKISIGEIAGKTIGGAAVGGFLGGVVGGISGGVRGRINRKAEIATKLTEKRPSVDVVKYKATPEDPNVSKALQAIQQKQILKDPAAVKALQQDIDPTDIQFIKASSEADKQLFRNQFKLAEMASKDKTITQRPVEVSGNAMLDRVKHIMSKRQDVGKQIGETVKNFPDEKLSISEAYDDFLKEIQNAGVRRTTGDNLNFTQSSWRNQPDVKRAIQQLYIDLKPSKTTGLSQMKALRIYRLRQQLFDDLNLANKTNALPDNASRILNKTRGNLEKPLMDVSGEYKKLATDYSKLSQAVTEFNKIMGRDFSITDDLAALRAGEVGYRILGNASARPLKILQLIDDTAKSYKFKSSIDLRNQFLFSDFLEDLFGMTQKRSLGGQVQRAFEGVDIAEQALTGGVSGKINAAQKLFKFIRRITPENQKEAVRQLIGLIK